MKKKIKSSIRKENKKNYMLREMLDRSTFKEIPEELTDYVTEGTVTEMKYSAAMNDISWSDYLNASGMADDVLITATGSRFLGQKRIPLYVDEVEEIMNK